ncbi:hypothetical protein [Halobacterium hubeiense]|uniref:hypothetical protein n=1 Tax=Halobacterium hubeiense TaxID=1407499 RepID=UPI003C72EF8C
METQRSRARLGVYILVFFAMIVVGALVWSLLNEPITAALEFGSAYSNSSTADQYIGTLSSTWAYLLYFVLFLAGFALMGRAILEGRVR